MNTKILLMSLLSCILGQSLFAAQSNSSVVDKSRHDKWREIASFAYSNGMSCQKQWPAVSDKLAFFDKNTMTLSMGGNKVIDIRAEDLPLVNVVLKEVEQAYARFNAQVKK
jgi:hypothetical protein